MSSRISRLSLIAFAVLLLLSGFLLSVAGGYWPWYLVMAVLAVVPILFGPNRYRIYGIIALLLSVYLILGDISSGKRYQKKIQEIKTHWGTTNAP
jgi:uncharacterized membrane protein